MQKDNTTFASKKKDRLEAIRLLTEPPVILETNGGMGELYNHCYHGIKNGVVFEKDKKKAVFLAEQRPSWDVWNCDCVNGIKNGIGGNKKFNLIDIDPYGSCWDIVDAVFMNGRKLAKRLVIVCNDGMRQKIQISGAGNIKQLIEIKRQYGNNIHPKYLEVCKKLLNQKAATRGLRVSSFKGYYCGHQGQMTHWLAEIFNDAE